MDTADHKLICHILVCFHVGDTKSLPALFIKLVLGYAANSYDGQKHFLCKIIMILVNSTS